LFLRHAGHRQIPTALRALIDMICQPDPAATASLSEGYEKMRAAAGRPIVGVVPQAAWYDFRLPLDTKVSRVKIKGAAIPSPRRRRVCHRSLALRSPPA
jgi:hypothetical protein